MALERSVIRRPFATAFVVTGLLAACIAGSAREAAAQTERYALIVEGASGEDQYALLHRGWLDAIVNRLRDDFKFDADKLTVLAESPAVGEARATADEVRAAVTKLIGVMGQDDLLFVMLIGHGSGQGPDAKFNLIGRDLTVSDWSELFSAIPGRIAFVDATSSSFPFLAGLAGEGRVVITATASFAQRLHTQFAGAFIEALGAEAADADKNERISLFEAFNHASRLVSQHYDEAGNMATETALLDDTGDGAGRAADADGPDGDLAALTYLDTLELPTSSDPEVQQLIQRQAALTAEVDDLRRNRAAMGDEAFHREFERLIVDLALVSRDVRRRTGG